MVGHTADLKCDSSEVALGTAENRVEPRAPFEIDDRQAIFGRKDNVVMKAHMGRWHRHLLRARWSLGLLGFHQMSTRRRRSASICCWASVLSLGCRASCFTHPCRGALLG